MFTVQLKSGKELYFDNDVSDDQVRQAILEYSPNEFGDESFIEKNKADSEKQNTSNSSLESTQQPSIIKDSFAFIKDNIALEITVIVVILMIAFLFSIRQKIFNFFRFLYLKTKEYFLYILISVLVMTVYYIAFAEKTYDDCILNHVKSTGGNYAIDLIKDSCRKKYR